MVQRMSVKSNDGGGVWVYGQRRSLQSNDGGGGLWYKM